MKGIAEHLGGIRTHTSWIMSSYEHILPFIHSNFAKTCVPVKYWAWYNRLRLPHPHKNMWPCAYIRNYEYINGNIFNVTTIHTLLFFYVLRRLVNGSKHCLVYMYTSSFICFKIFKSTIFDLLRRIFFPPTSIFIYVDKCSITFHYPFSLLKCITIIIMVHTLCSV